MSLLYKTLFEVKLMHEYFLTREDGRTPYAFTDQQQRIDFLMEGFTQDLESVNEDLEYIFPEGLKSAYDEYGLKLVTSYSGFKVAIRVDERVRPDRSLLYRPGSGLPGTLPIVILLAKKNNTIDRYTNSRFITPVPSCYFFTNEALGHAKTAPFLTETIDDFDNGYSYEQGELASFGTADIRAYYRENGTDRWDLVTGAGFAGENDRVFTPSSFSYAFPPNTLVTEASFVLKDYNDDPVQTIDIHGADPLKKVALNFSGRPDFFSRPVNEPFRNARYKLEVTGNNGYSAKSSLVFGDTVYDKRLWACVCMKAKTEDDRFGLIASDGFLVKRRDPAGNWTEAPVFEVPVKSRFSYWRYVNDKGKELKLAPELADYLFKEGKFLLTRKPRTLAKLWLLLQKEGAPDTRYVPNPLGYDLKKDSQQRLYFDIRVPQSNLFPVV